MIPLRWRRPARALWLVLVGLILIFHLAGVVVRFNELRQVCLAPEAVCHAPPPPFRPMPADVAALQASGFSLADYALLEAGKWVVFSAIWLAVGGLIFARQSDEWLALVVAFWLVTFPTQWDGIHEALTRAYPLAAIPVGLLQSLSVWGLILFVGLFPNGRFAPGWSRWIAVVWVGLSFLPNPIKDTLFPIQICLFVALLVAQVIRYRRHSTPLERERTRWVVFGFCFAIAVFLFIAVTVSLGNIQVGPASGTFSGELIYQVSVAVIPLSIGAAILRNRLFDIDVIIRRTLIYALLTGLLALAYFGSVVVLQNTFSALTGQGRSTLVTVLSTLVIAALFVPLRARVQALIDRQLYRRKYDAARTLAAFSASLRDETNLDQLTAHLTGVVDKAMQPATLELWLAAEGRLKLEQ